MIFYDITKSSSFPKIRVPWEKGHISAWQTQHQDIVYHFSLGSGAWLSLEGTSLFQSCNSCAGPGDHRSPHLEQGVGRKLKGERLRKRRKGMYFFKRKLKPLNRFTKWCLIFQWQGSKKNVLVVQPKCDNMRAQRQILGRNAYNSRDISNWIPVIFVIQLPVFVVEADPIVMQQGSFRWAGFGSFWNGSQLLSFPQQHARLKNHRRSWHGPFVGGSVLSCFSPCGDMTIRHSSLHPDDINLGATYHRATPLFMSKQVIMHCYFSRPTDRNIRFCISSQWSSEPKKQRNQK